MNTNRTAYVALNLLCLMIVSFNAEATLNLEAIPVVPRLGPEDVQSIEQMARQDTNIVNELEIAMKSNPNSTPLAEKPLLSQEDRFALTEKLNEVFTGIPEARLEAVAIAIHEDKYYRSVLV